MLKQLLAGLTAAATTGCTLVARGPVVTGVGDVRTEGRSLANYRRIEFGGAGNVVVKVGEPFTFSATAEQNLLDEIETEIEGETLHIRFRSNLRPNHPIKIEISAPDVEEFVLAGAGDVRIENAETESLHLRMAGAGNLRASGKVRDLKANLDGAGNLEAFDLEAEHVKLSVAGAGSAEVNAHASLEASVSGVGTVRYKGNPSTVRRSVHGVGKIDRA